MMMRNTLPPPASNDLLYVVVARCRRTLRFVEPTKYKACYATKDSDGTFRELVGYSEQYHCQDDGEHSDNPEKIAALKHQAKGFAGAHFDFGEGNAAYNPKRDDHD